MKKTKQDAINWLKAALKRQQEFQNEVRKRFAQQNYATAV